jgi:hypothetical protein
MIIWQILNKYFFLVQSDFGSVQNLPIILQSLVKNYLIFHNGLI